MLSVSMLLVDITVVLVDDSLDKPVEIKESVVVVAIVEVELRLVVVTSWQFTFLFNFPFLHLTVA